MLFFHECFLYVWLKKVVVHFCFAFTHVVHDIVEFFLFSLEWRT